MEEAVRWNISVSKETDLTLRTYLGSQGAKKGDLSKFIEEAVRWRVLHRKVQDIKGRNADTEPSELQRIIDGAVREVRAERATKLGRSKVRSPKVQAGKGLTS
jgi:Ribbon-helix-helix domain